MTIFEADFVVRALLAGTPIALLAGLAGYFLLLRSQMFVADALSHVAFTGACAALAAGIDLRLGLFAATIGIGVLLAGLGKRGNPGDVITGTVFAWVLGLGVLFLAIYTTSRSAGGPVAGVSILFGTIFGLSQSAAWLAMAIGIAMIALLILVARPLLFASVDPRVAMAHRVPVRMMGMAFLAVVGVTAAEATQAIGSLLLLGLLAAPAGATALITRRPYLGMVIAALSSAIALWAGIFISYYVPKVPPSFAIVAVATAWFLLAVLVGRIPAKLRARRARRAGAARDQAPASSSIASA